MFWGIPHLARWIGCGVHWIFRSLDLGIVIVYQLDLCNIIFFHYILSTNKVYLTLSIANKFIGSQIYSIHNPPLLSAWYEKKADENVEQS